ncbi:hypothetical protein QL285_090617 [Trifolium repens]|nr:hypothetical protein QL285_090617 [Trifolium repens]
MLNCCALELDQFGFMMMICGIILSMWEMSEGNALYNYTKQKAFDTMDKVLEMRLSSNGMKEFKCPDFLVENYKPCFAHLCYACRMHNFCS